MKLLVINPNTTRAMTEAVVNEVVRHAGIRAQVVGVTAATGPAVIADRESFQEGATSGAVLLARHAAGFDAAILACFGDPGLAAIRSASRIPIVGLAEAACGQAARWREPWAIVTAGASWVSMLRETVAGLGLQEHFIDVFALQATGLDVVRDGSRYAREVQLAVDTACADGARTVILGGAAMAGMARSLTAPARLLDCVRSATEAALALGGRR